MLTVVIGVQTFWISRALDTLRDEMHRGFGRLDVGIDRLEARMERFDGREPPTLRRV